MNKNLIKICLFVFGISFVMAPFIVLAAPESRVQLSVSVLERKSTDTINDFDFSSINNQDPLKQVAGASTQNTLEQSENISFLQKLKNFFIRRFA
jgi:hypothetical protein